MFDALDCDQSGTIDSDEFLEGQYHTVHVQ